MPITNIGYKVDTDVVKEEAKGRYSRDDVTLLANAATLEVGTVLEINGAGKYIPVATAANAAAVLLQHAAISATDQTVVVLSRRAQVVQQALVWPAGFSGANQTAALAALQAKGIVARNGV